MQLSFADEVRSALPSKFVSTSAKALTTVLTFPLGVVFVNVFASVKISFTPSPLLSTEPVAVAYVRWTPFPHCFVPATVSVATLIGPQFGLFVTAFAPANAVPSAASAMAYVL